MTITTAIKTIAADLTRAHRARVGHHMSVARRHAVIDAWVDRTNTANGVTTTATYLRDVIGADADFIHRYASPYGTAVAKAYRAVYGANPAKTGVARRGVRIFDAYGYTDADVLDAGARAYARTAALIAA